MSKTKFVFVGLKFILKGTLGDNNWYISDVEVTLNTIDQESGISSTEYSLDGLNWKTYSDPIIISNDGTITAYCRSTDNAGNVEETKSKTIKIDKTWPNVLIVRPSAHELYEVGVTLDFSANDLHSGLSQLWTLLIDADEGSQSVETGDEVDVGVYEFMVMAKDQAGNYVESEQIFFVVYDPEGGFVTGGGWIYSEPEAFKWDEQAQGKASFGFVSKYSKGATTPTGQAEFVFRTGNLNFHSRSYDWLVVTGSDYAKLKGWGSINGEGDYRFMLWAGDAPDTLRIRIWQEDDVGNEFDVYDNGFDQNVDGGSIIIHGG